MHRPLRGSIRRPAAAATLFALSTLLAVGSADAQLFGGRNNPVPPADLPGIVQTQSPAAVAEQSIRVDRVEDQMRQLNGRIDELTWQVQQLQDMIRRLQEDNEFRFQELEGGPRPERRSDVPATTAPAAPSGSVGTSSTAQPGPVPDLQTGFSMDTDEQIGAPPQILGTIPGDGTASAPPSQSAVGGPLDLSAIASGGEFQTPLGQPPGLPGAGAPVAAGELLPPPGSGAQPNQQVAALGGSEDAGTAYDRAYGFIVAGDYAAAETALKRFLDEHPGTPQTGSALFWLGESFYARERFRDAADAFLTTYRDYPTSSKAPESLLKLGLSLEGLGETDAACATYGELAKKFPSAPGALRARVEQQQQTAGC